MAECFSALLVASADKSVKFVAKYIDSDDEATAEAAMLALGFTTRFAGSDATLGLAFATSGKLFAFFSPLLGWLGVALTGSDTASNVLFGNLQQITAQQVGRRRKADGARLRFGKDADAYQCT